MLSQSFVSKSDHSLLIESKFAIKIDILVSAIESNCLTMFSSS